MANPISNSETLPPPPPPGEADRKLETAMNQMDAGVEAGQKIKGEQALENKGFARVLGKLTDKLLNRQPQEPAPTAAEIALNAMETIGTDAIMPREGQRHVVDAGPSVRNPDNLPITPKGEKPMEDLEFTDPTAGDPSPEQAARNAAAADMLKATQDNLAQAKVDRQSEAVADFVQAEPPSNLSAEDEAKRRQLGMSVQEYQNYQAQIPREQQHRADTAAREQAEQQVKQQAEAEEKVRQEQADTRAEAGFQPWKTGDAETDALGEEIKKMQQKIRELKTNGATDNRDTIASTETSLQHQLTSAERKWKAMENKAYWAKKNAQEGPRLNFKLKDVGEGLAGQVKRTEDGSVDRGPGKPTVNTGELQQAANRVHEALRGKTPEERKVILDALDPHVRRVLEIDEQQAEVRHQRQLREEQAKQDALNPDEARQRKRQETMAEWLKQNPEPTDSPLEHSTWMSKLAAKTAELDDQDLAESRRRQEVKQAAVAAEPENTAATGADAKPAAETAAQPETDTAKIARLESTIAQLMQEQADDKRQQDEAIAALEADPELKAKIDKLPPEVKKKMKANKWMKLMTYGLIMGVGATGTIAKVAAGEMGGRRN